jgi:hypothetical protein
MTKNAIHRRGTAMHPFRSTFVPVTKSGSVIDGSTKSADIVDIVETLAKTVGRCEAQPALESWPAAGGGLLVAMTVPAFAGKAPPRPAIKDLFARIDGSGAVCVILPYVGLEADATLCVAALFAAELDLATDRIWVDDMFSVRGSTMDHDALKRRIVDLDPTMELSLRICAASIRALLIAAAAEIWGVPSGACGTGRGSVIHRPTRRTFSFAALACDAALRPPPAPIVLRCGRVIDCAAP